MCCYLGVGTVEDDEVMTAEIWWTGLVPFWKRSQRAPSPLLPYRDTMRSWLSMNKEVDSHQIPLSFISQPAYMDYTTKWNVSMSQLNFLREEIWLAQHHTMPSTATFPIQSEWSIQASYYQLWFMKLGSFQACECLTLGIGNCHKKYF